MPNIVSDLAVVLPHPLLEPSNDWFLLAAGHHRLIQIHPRHTVPYAGWTLLIFFRWILYYPAPPRRPAAP